MSIRVETSRDEPSGIWALVDTRQHRYQSVSVSYFLLHLSIFFASDIQ